MSCRILPILLIALAGIGLAAPALTHPVLAAPEPSRLPLSWEFDFTHGPFERIIIPVNGQSQAFWFMRYTVTNNSGRDILFTPSFELVGDTGQVTPAFKDVPNDVFRKIKEMYGNKLLASPTDIFGKLLQGQDNAKDGVMIFPGLDPDARNFQLFIAGLSGETAEVKNPITSKPVILQKTLELDYNIPGQAIGIDPHSQLLATKWVMK